MLDLAEQQLVVNLRHYIALPAEKLLLMGFFNFSLAVTSIAIKYLVAFSTTSMRIYHKLAIGHLMRSWARFALQCFSLTKQSAL